MTKQTQANHMNTKSVRKFWQFTLLFLLALIVFNDLLSKLYESIRTALPFNDVGVFLILAVLFALLFWELIGKIKDNKQVSWKLRDTFIVAVMIKSLWLIIWAFITLSFVPLSYFNFIDFSIYQWVSSSTFKNIHLILAFVYGAGVYLTLKFYHWDSMASKLNRIKKSTEVGFELNDDRTLGETEAFQNCKTLAELKELDKLGRFDYAQQISHIIINNGEKKSFAIGINGEWGSGKTSFIQMVRSINELQYNDHCIFINFNPWYFTGTEKVLKKFYDTLIKTVGNNFSITFRNDLTRYFELICATESKIWKTNFLQYFKRNVEFDSQLDDLKKHFKGLPQKIVIVIDDLDRLQKDEILVLFRTIRLIGDFPNVVYLVGYSHDYVRSILEENKETTDDQASFMEKIFQLEFELPEPILSDLKNYCRVEFQSYMTSDLDKNKDIIDTIIENNILDNLRDIKRFSNQLKINTSLQEIRDNTFLPQFFLLELIYYTDSNAYYKLWDNETWVIPECKERIQSLFNLIEKLKTYTKLSITNPRHFDKYHFKRLDKQSDIDFKEVKSLFAETDYQEKMKDLYHLSYVSQTQIIDHILKFTESFENNSDEFDKGNWQQYLDRIFYLFEFIYISERYYKNYFNKGANVREQRLIKGISIICKLIPSEKKPFKKEVDYFKTKLDNKSFSDFLLTFASLDKELHVRFYKLHELFRDKIRNEIEMHSINTMSILISLFNYTKFMKLADGLVGDYVFSDEAILNGLRENSELLYTDIKNLDKGIPILDILGSKENLLKLNNLKSQGIFNMLDDLDIFYLYEKKKGGEFKFNLDIDSYIYNFELSDQSSDLDLTIENKDSFNYNLQLKSIEDGYEIYPNGSTAPIVIKIIGDLTLQLFQRNSNLHLRLYNSESSPSQQFKIASDITFKNINCYLLCEKIQQISQLRNKLSNLNN